MDMCQLIRRRILVRSLSFAQPQTASQRDEVDDVNHSHLCPLVATPWRPVDLFTHAPDGCLHSKPLIG
jgi:hypothetical protein